MRILFFRWLDASTPAQSGLLTYTCVVNAPHSPIYWVNARKIKILHDEVVALKPRAAAGSFDNKIVEFKLKLENRCPPIQLPLSGAGAAPQMNGLYLLFISDDAIVSFPQIVYATELQYTDA